MPGARSKKKEPAPGTAPVTPEMQAFLDSFAETDDRIQSARAAGVRWKVVEGWLTESSAFKAHFDELMNERQVQMLDQWAKKGRTGDVAAAKNYLAAVGSRLGRSVEDEDGASTVDGSDARDFALSVFGPRESEVN